ncbi:DUF3696 domain-containing protein [Arthrobacter sp. R4-81]
MPSATNVRGTGKKIVALCGQVGLERGIDLALELVHARWSARSLNDLWAKSTMEFDAAERKTLSRAGSFNYENTSKLMAHLGVENVNFPFAPQVAREIYLLTSHGEATDSELRQLLHELFEWLLSMKLSKVSLAGLQHITSETHARLLAALAVPTASVFDPACGMGSVLLEAARSGSRELFGMEIDPAVARLARMRLELAGHSAEIRVGDALQESWPRHVETIVIDPPYGIKRTGLQSPLESQLEKTIGRNLETSWVMKTVHDLAEGQQGLLLLPLTTTFGSSGEFLIGSLLDVGCIEAVVRLSAADGGRSGMLLSLWVLRRPSRHVDSREVLMIDGDTISSPLTGSRGLAEESINVIADVFRRWRADSGKPSDTTIAKSVPYAHIHRENVLDPARYLDKNPNSRGPRLVAPVHLLSELRVSNFKAFGRSTSVPFRPLTLLYGRNSSGKSSVLQAIQLLRQSLPEDCLVTQGQHTDAGSFRTCVHNHDVDRAIHIGLTFGNNPAVTIRDGDPSPALIRRVDYSFSMGGNQCADRVDAKYSLGSAAFGYQIKPAHEDERAASELSLDMHQIQQLMNIVADADSTYASRPQRSSHASNGAVTRLLKKINLDGIDVAADGLVPGTSIATDLSRGGVTERELTTTESYVRKGLKLAAGIGRELVEILGPMSYLGPLRQAPQRVHVRSNAADASSELALSLFDNRSEQVQISAWMQKIGIPYELEVLALDAGKGSDILGNPLAISLTDKRSGVILSPSDVGFGVSQVLPILVELSARQSSLICIEQPEIHLHPAMQSEMADLLIESIDPTGRANQVIAETHSEHLVLRIQRRIKERALDPELVSILYVDQDDEGDAIVVPLRIDREGDFVDPWPNGFFEERLDEVFARL